MTDHHPYHSCDVFYLNFLLDDDDDERASDEQEASE
jgi:hypothetical protein